MAERRMFAKTIIDSDAFLEMPVTTQNLYFHLGMRADDDGVINNSKSIMRMCGARDDDMVILITKKFVIPLDSSIIIIKHWKINNYIQKDRYKKSKYYDLIERLSLDENQAYTTNENTICTQDVYEVDTQVRLGKDSIDKDNIKENNIKEKSTRFSPPSLEEVTAFCKERKNKVDPEAFIAFYSSKGWKVGKNPMKDWKAAIITWERRTAAETTTSQSKYTSGGFETL